MKKIGFKNFRRFEDFPLLNLSPITIFVGENNAGKSTVVKGVLALYDFLKNERFFDYSILDNVYDESRQNNFKKLLRNVKFCFNNNYLAHVGTFKRAINNNSKDNAITFSIEIDGLLIEVVVRGKMVDSESVSGNVEHINIFHKELSITMVFDLMNDISSITFSPSDISSNGSVYADYFREFSIDYKFNASISENIDLFHGDILSTLVSSQENALKKRLSDSLDLIDKKCKDKTSDEKEIVRFLNLYRDVACKQLNANRKGNANQIVLPGSSTSIMKRWKIEYIYAHAVSQTVIYSAKDTNDYLSMTVHNFAPYSRDSKRKKYITYWMKVLGIGKDYQIQSVGGEAHIVYITNIDGKKVHLADKGMGSIQLMILLFKIATDLPDKKEKSFIERNMSGKIIIMEEPEQNLHPMLQSKLADLLFHLSVDYGYRFIIETHSEYLVRKTQVIVKNEFSGRDIEHKFEDNPFRVYYFPSEGLPQDMMYRPDGKFDEEFGRGFYDEATSLAFQVLC